MNENGKTPRRQFPAALKLDYRTLGMFALNNMDSIP